MRHHRSKRRSERVSLRIDIVPGFDVGEVNRTNKHRWGVSGQVPSHGNLFREVEPRSEFQAST